MDTSGWKTGRISHNLCQLEFKYKNHPGLPWMVFLHGFGQNFEAFSDVYETLEGKYSFLSFNLFFHGESDIDGNKPLEISEWEALILAIFAQLNIEKAHWMGFSMGGKFTMISAERLPQLFSEITLLAPDGIVMSPWYRFATQGILGRFSLWVLLKYIPAIRVLVLIFSKIGLIKSSVGRFSEHQLNSSEKRQLVLDVWLRFRKIWPNEKVWIKNLKDHQIPMGIILGKYDSIISIQKFKNKRKEIPEIHWVELSAGHSNLVQKFAKTITGKV